MKLAEWRKTCCSGRFAIWKRLKSVAIATVYVVVFFAPAGAWAEQRELSFRGQKIVVNGLNEGDWEYVGGEPDSGTEELVLVFTNTALTGTLVLPYTVQARVLAVGGGGAGGYGNIGTTYPGGGGGAGGFLELPSDGYVAGTYTITVGAGGKVTTAAGSGENGQPSTIVSSTTEIKALGGGGGGSRSDGNGTNIVGMVVATGGGGGGQISSGVFGQGGLGTMFNGGNAVNNNRGAGGGGAGGDGGDATTSKSGDGGVGTNSTILADIDTDKLKWVPRRYGGGGAGGKTNGSRDAATTAVDGGGLGGANGVASENGALCTGGGGGGGGRGTSTNPQYAIGGAGGSGIVIIRITDISVPLVWTPIDVQVGVNKGKIFVDSNASWSRVNPSDLSSDIIIAYSNTTIKGGLAFFNPTNDTEDLPPIWANARILAVGGGGGGGFVNVRSGNGGAGGGGGAGGFVERGGFVFDNNFSFSIEVGKGGAAGAANEEAGKPGGKSSVTKTARNDETQVANVIDDALGGGGGGARCAGGEGGSGGGGSMIGGSVKVSGGSGTAGQGFAGGDGDNTLRGAGGGGANGPGETTGVDSAGAGGEGTNSFITGSEVWYAGGGGGASINPKQWTSWTLGGDGGKGGGGRGAGAQGKGEPGTYCDVDPIPATDGADGLGGGGGGGTSYDGADPELYPAGKGGNGVVIIRLSGFVVESIPLPPTTDFVYDGTEREGVKEFFAYTFKPGSKPKATNADVYTVTATIAADAPYEWADGGRGDRTVTWKISQLKVDVPNWRTDNPPRANYFTFGDNNRKAEEEKLAIDPDKWLLAERAEYSGETCAVTNSAGLQLPYCTLTGHRETNAGSYSFTATLVTKDPSGNSATNFCWRTAGAGGIMGPRQVDWTIAQAENAIQTLSLANWQEGTTEPAPSSTWQWSAVTALYPTHDVVKYQWRPITSGIWSDLKVPFDPPKDPGRYKLRAVISKDSNHEPGNWVGAEKEINFLVWRHPSKTLADYVNICVNGYTGAATPLKGFPILVRLREPVRDATGAITNGLPGFSYADVRNPETDLRFITINVDEWQVSDTNRASKATDTLLPYEVDTWNSAGESLVWVQLPEVKNKTTKFRMYWRLRPGESAVPDLYPTDVWTNGYVGVWHLGGVKGLKNSTVIGEALDATGPVEYVDMVAGSAALATSDSVTAPNYEPYLESTTQTPRFTFTGWYQGLGYASDEDKMDVLFLGKKLGGQTSNPWDYKDGWGWRYYRQTNGNDPRPLAYFSGNQTADWKNQTSLVTKPRFLTMATDTTGSKSVYYDGVLQNNYTKNLYTNALPFQIVGPKFAADEVRIANVKRTDTWVKAEYESVNNAKYCTFGLVNQLQADGSRAWVNYWSAEPWANARLEPGTENGRYWLKGEAPKLDPPSIVTNYYFGALGKSYLDVKRIGTVLAVYRAMPSGEVVVFPSEYGQYALDFTMAELADGAGTGYPGPHVLYDGPRTIDIEILKPDPRPIDPTRGGGGSAAVNLRVLLANDDIDGREAGNAVSNQSYFAWRHDDQLEPPTVMTNVTATATEIMTNNLLKGTEHALTNAQGAATWRLEDVYLGNMMNADPDPAAAALLAGQKSLPWSASSKNSSADPADWDLPLDRRMVGQMVMRNMGSDPGETEDDVADACIRSPWYTNGVGTVYFDAVNAYPQTAASFRLQVEVSTNALDGLVGEQKKGVSWTRLEKVITLSYNGTSFVNPVTNHWAEVNVTGGEGLDRFVRVIAPVQAVYGRTPCRVRIRRVSKLDESSISNEDDWKGFIVVDNVIVSWPTGAAGLHPRGWYDASKRGKQALGWETALSVNYPTATETNLYVSANFDGDPSTVLSARCHWRWRYLNQSFVPARAPSGTSWKDNYSTVYLDKDNVMRSTEPFDLPGLVGDVEYYFDLTAILPFYDYVDYSGVTVAKPTADYSEEPAKGVTSRRQETDKLASQGTDWYVRLRPGASDYESIRVFAKDGTGAVRAFDLVLVEDHLWRGYFKTAKEDAGKVFSYRLEALTPTVPGSTEPQLATNFWVAGEDLSKPTSVPASPVLREGAAGDWEKLYVDAATGALLFQLDDRSLSLTITHADYQDFNGWNDAVSREDPPLFTGSAIEGPRKSGVSSKMQRLEETFDRWTVTPETKDQWQEPFAGIIDVGTGAGKRAYEPFVTDRTPNGWTANNAMWTAEFFHPVVTNSQAQSGLALELLGSTGGSLQLLSPTEHPRGIGTVSYSARIGQSIDFYDFNYSEAEKPSELTDYTFITRAAFDLNKNRNFAGSAALSLVAFYRAKAGCYEVRWEQLNGVLESATTFGGPARDSQRLCLYRWARGDSGEIEAELLGAVTNNVNVNYTWWSDAKGTKKAYAVNLTNNTRVKQPEAAGYGAGDYFLPIYISVKKVSDTVTEVAAGVYSCGGYNYGNEKGGLTANDPESKYTQRNWVSLFYRDTSKKRLSSGAYGVLSANCEAVFLRPARRTAMSKPNTSNFNFATNQFCACANTAMNFNGEYVECKDDLAWDWAIDGQRMDSFDESSDTEPGRWGIYAKTPSANLELWLGTPGVGEWTYYGSRKVSGFGTTDKSGDKGEFVLNDVVDRAVQLKVAEAQSTDVVLTGAGFTQWRGDNYGDVTGDTMGYAIGNANRGYPSNIVFTSGIMVANTAKGLFQKLHLSAKRTPVGKPASIRSPFFDGMAEGNGRHGKGLGMISFDYENAQTNVNLLVQIATNTPAGSDITKLTQSIDTNFDWTTVTNFSFAGASRQELRNGVRSVYLGLHGVDGLVRVVLDPDVVADVQTNTVTDASAFGEVDITRVVIRDEPELEAADWWGWNVRAAEFRENAVRDDQRTYLPDADEPGMPVVLNSSIKEFVPENDVEYVKERMPFVQTPTFTNNIVGEVSFLARRYDDGRDGQYAEIELYGAYAGHEADETQWRPLQQFIVSNTTYQAFSFRGAGTFSAFRLAVTGVKGVTHPGVPRAQDPAVRVVIDEVAVFEAVNPEMDFRYVYPFRDGMDETAACTNVVDASGAPLADAQPLCGESWTVQAEIRKARLPDEIDMKVHPPRVIFHWFVGNYPWGYGKWRTLSKAEGHQQAELALADGEEMVFRGSLLKAREAVVPATADAPTVVQYSADVIYHTVGGLEFTNSLVRNAATTWERPSWYAPVDHNAGKALVSAYTILDEIAPHRAWINEVNLWDSRNPTTFAEYADTNQYIEVAAPELQSLEGWRLEYISNDKTVNTLVRFTSSDTGDGYAPPTKDLKGVPVAKLNEYRTNDYVFLAVQSPKTRSAGTWASVPGAIDGTWRDFNGFGGILDQKEPVAIRLIRPSQVVEHEIVVEGTNRWESGRHPDRDNPTNWIAKVEQEVLDAKSSLFYVGNEDPDVKGLQSIGVVRNTGAVSNDWRNLMVQTPGRVNEGQIVPRGYVLYSNGDFMIVRARIAETGHILQTVADAVETPDEVTLMIRKGGEGTNITYRVADWWETSFVMTNGQMMAETVGRRGTYTVTVGAGQSNDVTVVAAAQPLTELSEKYGLTPENRYTPAVMDWLEKGKNLFDEPFENPGEIHLAEFRTPINGLYITNLDLTAMYWLDIDPTASNTWLKGGIVNSRHGGIFPIVLDDPPPAVTNFRMGVHMEITNLLSGVAYAPYVLRGLRPGETSMNHVGNWTSVTFKITGDIQISDPAYAGRERWLPLRWFVFDSKPGATERVGASASFGDDFRATVDVWDPKDESAAIYTEGWSAFPEANVFYRWALDGRNAPVTIEPLRPESTYSD